LKFIPERFDPESEYFLKPGTREIRSPYAYIPFSYGVRSCPGQNFSKLELKFLLARFITTVRYEIDECLLSNENVRFQVLNSFRLNLRYIGKS